MRLNESTLCVLDFESTGVVAGYPNEPWQIGLICLRDGVVDAASSWEQFMRIDATRPFNPHAPGRHAQLRDVLADAPKREMLLPKLREYLKADARVAHNCSTEQKMLRMIAPMHCFDPWIDTLKLAREAWPGLASYALESLVETLQLEERIETLVPDRTAHDALYDAVAAAVILERLCIEGWGNISLQNLMSKS